MELPIKKPEAKHIIVPTEPTQEMLNAYDEARAATTMHPPGSIETYNPHQAYWALLNAAPKMLNRETDLILKSELARLQKIERAALDLSTAMVDTEAEGGEYELVDKQWKNLTAAMQPIQ